MKKIFALVLAVVFVLALFAACGDSTPLTEWDNYQKTLDQLGRNEVIEIYKEACEDYLAR